MLKVISMILLTTTLWASNINSIVYQCEVLSSEGELENASHAVVEMDQKNNVNLKFFGEELDVIYTKLSVKADEVEEDDELLIITRKGPAAEKRVVRIDRDQLLIEVELSDRNNRYDIFGWFNEINAVALLKCVTQESME